MGCHCGRLLFTEQAPHIIQMLLLDKSRRPKGIAAYRTGLFRNTRLRKGTGKGGNWRTKPPDAESAVWGQNPESVGKARTCPVHHIMIARERSFFPRGHDACPENAVCATCSLETARKGGC